MPEFISEAFGLSCITVEYLIDFQFLLMQSDNRQKNILLIIMIN